MRDSGTTGYSGTYLAWGPPGTGKTTSLAKQVQKIISQAQPGDRCPVLVCSLTKSAAAEVAGRDLPLPRSHVGTLHSMAYRAIGSPEIAETHLDEWNEHKQQFRMSIGSGADVDEMGCDQPPGQQPGDDLLGDMSLLRARMVPESYWPDRVQRFADSWTAWKNLNHYIDFTDMIEIALRDWKNSPPGQPRIIIADEVQDHSALELSLLRSWGKAAGALILTGDPWQSLYCWRGAHPELFLDPSIPEDHKRVLSQSYRIPRAVHARAMKWVRQLSDWTDIQYKPRDFDGRVMHCDSTWKTPEPAVDIAERLLTEANDDGQPKTVMFQTACSYMLPPVMAVLRRRGIPFANPWRTKHGGWNPLRAGKGVSMKQRLLNFLKHDASTFGIDSRRWTYEELNSWSSVIRASQTIQRGCKADITSQAKNNPHMLTTAAAMEQWFEDSAWADLRQRFESRDPELFDEDTPRCTLRALVGWWTERLLGNRRGSIDYLVSILDKQGHSALIDQPRCFVGTIHSFKGGEADACFLFPDVSPAGWAEWSIPGKKRDGVIRLFYVGMTRARQDLILCNQAAVQAVKLG
jgi:superfamily I DNA/RNA helicase